ncbi:DNA-binding protein [Enterococcus silesiacus]|uniref:Ciab protein n=1 Tax=Enterococcus silesiacus TaxID=332949 RepID=A0A0S3KDJ2_9ENTE|nr:DNA-binding protein [Enterococcus silesiacus]ALS02374.1 DNA-binding protein [Enterococcus silesiacus]OJG91349.1 ciab protein [Enterococcus silesiacus]
MAELSDSKLERQNILNNRLAMKEAEKQFNLSGIEMDGIIYYTRQQVSSFFDVDIRTIERVTEDNRQELEGNDLKMLSGKKLQEFKKNAAEVTDIDVGHKVVNLSVSSFRTLLNYAMLLQNSDQAKAVRNTILDIVIDVMNKQVGGNTKYINQRDEDYIKSAFINENYRKQYTDALNNYLEMGPVKYAVYTDKIYQSIFKERAKEYKKILKLSNNDRVRETMYSEIIDLVSSYESGLADCMKRKYLEKGNQKITPQELNEIIKEFSSMPLWKPLIAKARMKMASRDFVFRNAMHESLEDYIVPIDEGEYERFIGEKSMELNERLDKMQDVFKRLKDR